MFPMFIQTLWCWGLMTGVLMLFLTLPVVARLSVTGWRQKGAWSCGAYLVLMALCIAGYLILNFSAVYIYSQPEGALVPAPPNDAPGEVQLLAYATLVPAAVAENSRSIIPFALLGLPAFIAFLFAANFVSAKITKEQHR